jgi:hypothetical protein
MEDYYEEDDFNHDILVSKLNALNEQLGETDTYVGQYRIRSSKREFIIEEFGCVILLKVNQQKVTCSNIDMATAIMKVQYIENKYFNKQ